MSRMISGVSGGMQVTRSANNVYTVLLIASFVALLATVLYMAVVNQNRFNYTMPFGEDHENSQKEVQKYTGPSGEVARHARVVEEATKFDLGAGLGGGGEAGPVPE